MQGAPSISNHDIYYVEPNEPAPLAILHGCMVLGHAKD